MKKIKNKMVFTLNESDKFGYPTMSFIEDCQLDDIEDKDSLENFDLEQSKLNGSREKDS